MKTKLLFFTVLFLLLPFSIFSETTDVCVSPTGYTMIECVNDKTVGDTYLVYKAENTGATTATAATDPCSA